MFAWIEETSRENPLPTGVCSRISRFLNDYGIEFTDSRCHIDRRGFEPPHPLLRALRPTDQRDKPKYGFAYPDLHTCQLERGTSADGHCAQPEGHSVSGLRGFNPQGYASLGFHRIGGTGFEPASYVLPKHADEPSSPTRHQTRLRSSEFSSVGPVRLRQFLLLACRHRLIGLLPRGTISSNYYGALGTHGLAQASGRGLEPLTIWSTARCSTN